MAKKVQKSKEEVDLVEKVKLNVLSGFTPFDKVNAESIYDILQSNIYVDNVMVKTISDLKSQFVISNKRHPNIDETRQIYSSAYALYYEGED